MRAPLLALLGLILAASPALAGARSQDRHAGSQQRAKVTAPASTSAGKPARVTATRTAAPASARSATAAPSRSAVRGTGLRTAHAAPARGGRTRYAALTPATRGGYATQATTRRGAHYAVLQGGPVCRGSARNCRIYRVSAPQPMRWSQGLSPALNVQTSNCPAGTMATLATGHSNIVRCMPI